MDSSVAVLYIIMVSHLCCAIHCSSGTSNSNSTKKIYILTLLPYPNPTPLFSPSFDEGLDIIPALDLAAQHVNQREGFLDGYELQLVHRDGGCDVPTTTFSGLVSGLFVTNNPVVGLIGPGCSASTISSLSTINTQNRTSYIVVHGAGSPVINRAAFPNSFGTLGSAYGYVDVTLAMMNMSGWRNIAILVDASRPFFRDTVQALNQDLPRVFPDAKILFFVVVFDFYIPLNDLRDSTARVVFVFTSVDLSRRIMCLALRFGMLYPDYQWIFVGRTFDDFTADTIVFNYSAEMYNCSTEEIANEALKGTFFFNYKLLPFEEDEPTFSGFSHREYLEQYNNSVMEYKSNLENDQVTVSIWATYFYDAVWTWAIVLDHVTKSGNFDVEEYQFDQPNNALIEQFEQIDFEGISGRIKFGNETGSVNRFIDVFQVFNGTVEYVAYCNAGVIVKRTDRLEFIDDSFPVEATAIHPVVAVAIILPLLVQGVIIIVTQIVVTVNRNFESIKASSPNISHLAYIGIYLLVIGVTLTTVRNLFFLAGREAAICQAVWAFFLPYGFTLAFAAVAVKTWRLYRIFIHYLKPGKFISEPALFSIVCVLLSVDVVISIVWTSIDPFVLTRTIDTSDNVSPILRQQCDCNYIFVWLAILIGYNLLLLVALLTLVRLTRKIRNKSFQTVTLQVLVYGTFGVFGLGATLYYFAIFQQLDINISYAVLGVSINVMVLLYLACVFIPPVVPLMRHKWKESGCKIKDCSYINHRRIRLS